TGRGKHVPHAESLLNPVFNSRIEPLQPVYPVDSLTNSNGINGGVFLFETERPLLHSKNYVCTLCSICIFGCWICNIPSVIVTCYAYNESKRHQITRAKVLFNIGFMLSFFAPSGQITQAQARDIFDTLGSALTSVWSGVIQKPIETALQNGALMLAQLLAGLGTNGINLSSIFGGRSGINEAEFRGFWDSVLSGVTSIWTDVIQKPVEGALQTSALLLAQLLAGIGTEGISLGKRELVPELRGPIIDSLTDHATGLFQNTLKPIIESALSNVAINMAQILANFSQTGVIG
ncbi:unnamed protein product, partial [Didymodactylos carnosus]